MATAAAIDAMKNGGNAVDAAVAAALTLGVVDGSNSGIGGGCFILIRTAAGEFIAIDGRETAPAAATRELFLRDGKADTQLSQLGALASGVPGALAAYSYAIEHHGKLSLKKHLLAAAAIAEGGFELGHFYAGRIKSNVDALKKFPASAGIFFGPDGTALMEGQTLVQIDLARSYRAIAEQGIGWFYEGPYAEKLEAWMKENGGILRREDMKNYKVRLREPVRGSYRDSEVVSFPPPSSGGVHVLQILNLMEQFDFGKLGAGSVDSLHVMAEAMKLAFADRAHWLGDPDFTPVPRGLTAKDYARKLAAQISMEKAAGVETHGTPDDATANVFEKHTTHFSTADAEGNWVACTATINTAFGSKVIIPETGILLNNEMDDFSAQPGVPNAFGLVGGDANAVAPGKRPLSSMSPTIVSRGGQPILAVGAAGGPTIISQTVMAISMVVDFGFDVESALAAPRVHHQWKPDELKIEKGVGEQVLEQLTARGQTLAPEGKFGAAQAVARSSDGTFTGAADPRGEGSSAGW
jgi:gamma-glutamyltranspeptidase/glutathione hydrolase